MEITKKFEHTIFVLHDGLVYCCPKHKNIIPNLEQTSAFNGLERIDLTKTESYQLGYSLNCYYIGEISKSQKIDIYIYLLSSLEILLEEVGKYRVPIYALVGSVNLISEITYLKTGEKILDEKQAQIIKEKVLETMLFIKEELKI